jgi:hypothetical protein
LRLGWLGLHQAAQRKFTVFLLVIAAMRLGAELACRETFEQRNILSALQTPHTIRFIGSLAPLQKTKGGHSLR